MIPNWLADAEQLVGTFRRDAVTGETADWPNWLPTGTRDALVGAGIERPWRHQVEFAELVVQGRHAAITTPTASGKTLAYLLPILATRHAPPRPTQRTQLRAPRATALYLAPTKALAHDQARAAKALGEDGWRVATLDGDSSQDERRYARDHADYVLSNPDMLHYSVLPNHARWAPFLSGLRYVVVDEAHRYRGTFGAHVAAILRRLRRLCELHGSSPVFMLASATSPNAATFGGALIGEPEVAVVSASTAPRPGLDVALWQPSSSPTTEAATLLAQCVNDDRQTITFVASRNLAELIAVRAQEQASSTRTIASYRAGYLADDRREIEAQLQSGALNGVSATNALELGVNISGMDAVIVHGFPGTVAAMWQQFGRAGRSGRDALAVLVARDDPLDAYLFSHPELLFRAPLEHQILHPDNPYVLGPQLAAAAQESPLRPEDDRWFGASMAPLADHLAAQGLLRRRASGWYWTRPDRAADFVNIRALSGRGVDVIERDTGRVLGTVDGGSSDRVVHPDAVYLHQGESYLVTDYLPDERQALVVADRPRYYTQPLSGFEIAILATREQRPLGATQVSFGDVTLTSQVTGYLRRDEESGQVWDQNPLDLPSQTMQTQAVWWTIPPAIIAAAGITAAQVGSAAHAMEHCAIGLLPAFAPCDRWDIGGVSLAMHPDTGAATVFVHDGLPGGAGFARHGFEMSEAWLAATLDRLTSCRCETGCPACVVSPKCGNANQFLDRFAARDVLTQMLDRTSAG